MTARDQPRREPARRTLLRKAFLGALASSAAVLLLSATAPQGLAGGRQLEVVLHAGAAFAALAAAQLVLPRFLDGRSASQAALALACASYAAGALGAVATLSSGGAAARLAWGAGTLAAAAYLAWSALGPEGSVSSHAVAGLLAVGIAAPALALLGAADLLSVALFFAAALGFAARARRGIELVAAGLSAAAILALYGSLDRLLLSSDGSAAGTALELACALLLLASATTGARRLWERRASEAARHRAAQAIHGGLAQELALLVMAGRQGLESARSDPALRELVASSERALDETRHLISTLRRPSDAPFAAALAHEGREVASRVGLALELQLGDVDASEEVRDAMISILRESLALAAGEYGARTAVVTLADEQGPVLRIRHDGAVRRPQEGFPDLGSIERRARAAGGELELVSEPRGRLIQVTIP